jgi:hypothetical protein
LNKNKQVDKEAVLIKKTVSFLLPFCPIRRKKIIPVKSKASALTVQQNRSDAPPVPR